MIAKAAPMALVVCGWWKRKTRELADMIIALIMRMVVSGIWSLKSATIQESFKVEGKENDFFKSRSALWSKLIDNG